MTAARGTLFALAWLQSQTAVEEMRLKGLKRDSADKTGFSNGKDSTQ